MTAAPDVGFVRPAQAVLVAVAERALGRALPDGATWIEHGSNTVVLLAGETAVRIARQADAGAGLLRAQRVVDALPGLPFAVPASVGAAVEVEGITAVPVRRLGGAMHPSGTGDAASLRALLDALRSVDAAPLAGDLATPRGFMGGPGWATVLRDRVIPLLSADVRAVAVDRMDAMRELPDVPAALVHGDLAGGNVLWSTGTVSGVLDWDLATSDDPAIDVASLAAWHGWDVVSALADAGTVARATVFRRAAPLQAVAFTLLQGRPPVEVDAIARRVEARLRADR